MVSFRNMMLGCLAVKLRQSLTFVPIIMVGETPPFKKLLLAVDASPSSIKAFEFVASLSGSHRCEVLVFMAFQACGNQIVGYLKKLISRPFLKVNCLIPALKLLN
jgi:hypothetical protein